MPRSQPEKTKPKAINPSFHPKKRYCPFCSFYGTEENFNKHIAQKKKCNKDWAVARHQVHLDVGVIDGQGLDTVPNTHPSSPTKANRTLLCNDNSQQFDLSEDSSFQNHLGDDSNQGEQSSFGYDNIHVAITRPSDDQSTHSYEDSDNVDEFPLQLLQELPVEEPLVDDSVAPLPPNDVPNGTSGTDVSKALDQGGFSQVVVWPVDSNEMQLNLSANDKYNLKLLQITENGNFPHYYFAEILQWAKEAHLNGFNFTQIVHDRNTILYRFRKRFPHLPQCTT